MSSAVDKAVAALEMLPEDMQESAADYLLTQARKFRALKSAVGEGLADVEAGRTVPWDLEEFLAQARQETKP
jgi:predicted transcriptional regulator